MQKQFRIFTDEEVCAMPQVFARAAVERVFPGVISQQTLAILDSSGDGPPERYRMGKKVIYKTRPFLMWVENRMKAIQ